MIVYRIQDEYGRGPWRPGFSLKWVEDRNDLDNLLPWFREFINESIDIRPLIIPRMILGCGCLTIQQLQRWITPIEYGRLLNFGFKAVALEADVLAQSDIQCVFQRTEPLNKNYLVIQLYSKRGD